MTTLPPPAHAPKLARPKRPLAAAEATVQKARAEDSTAAQARGRQLTPSWSAATERVTALHTALDGQPTDEAVIRETLRELDRLDARAQAADGAVQQAREQSAAARAAVRQAGDGFGHTAAFPAAGTGSIGGVGRTGGGRIPTPGVVDPARRLGGALRPALGGRHSPAPSPRTTPPQAALRLAEKALADAQTEAAQARKAETDATASHERVKAALKGLQTRLGELTASLAEAPTDEEAQAQLARIDELAAAARVADAGPAGRAVVTGAG